MNLNEKLNSGVWRLIEIILVLAGLIWAAAFLRSDVNTNTHTNERQDKEHMRKDVGRVQFEAIRNQLDRIEKKIDN